MRNTYPRQVLVALVSAVLACAGAHLASAGPLTTQAQPSGHPRIRVDGANVQAKRTQNPTAAAAPPAQAEPSPVVPRGRVYLFRGALGLIFSRGMDRLTEKIQRAGITADVYEFTICS